MSKAIRFICIDDDPLDLMAVETMAGVHSNLEHCGSFSNLQDALSGVLAVKPELVFLDIEMPGGSGLDLLRKIKTEVPMAVFITSHPEFALEGFELSALDYVLKPLTQQRFAQTISRVQEYWEMKQKAAAYEVLFEKETLTIKEGYNQVRIPQPDIVYLEAMQDYTKIVTETRKYLTLSPLTQFLERLPPNRFMRVHRSYAVALGKIKELRQSELICGQAIIPIGKTYRMALLQIKL